MSITFIDVPIETDENALIGQAFDILEGFWADWTPDDGQLDVWLLTAIARMTAELMDVASAIPTSIFRYFGAGLIQLPPLDATAATATTTWTVKDAAGYLIPDGTNVGVRNAAGTLKGFQTVGDVVVSTGATVTAVGEVVITAIEDGSDYSNLGSVGGNVELIDAIDILPDGGTPIVLTAPTGGGQDAEDDPTYLNRLATELQLLSPRPILPADFAALALNIAGVARALAIDGYDALTATFDNARTVTVAVTDADGLSVGSLIRDAVATYLTSLREVNFVVYAINPTYTAVDAQFDVNMYPGFDNASVNAAVVAAIEAYLNPAVWGLPPFGDKRSWFNQDQVRFRDLIAVVGKVDGVQDVNFVKIRTGAGAYLEQDIALAGAAPVAEAGAVTGTVHP